MIFREDLSGRNVTTVRLSHVAFKGTFKMPLEHPDKKNNVADHIEKYTLFHKGQ